MKKDFNCEFTNCNLCGSDAWEKLFETRTLFGKCAEDLSVVYDIGKCKNCGLVYLKRRPTPEFKKALHDDEGYYTHTVQNDSGQGKPGFFRKIINHAQEAAISRYTDGVKVRKSSWITDFILWVIQDADIMTANILRWVIT